MPGRKRERERHKVKTRLVAQLACFYPTDSREESVLGSIPLPSYTIAPVGPEDHISRKYAFKVRSYFDTDSNTFKRILKAIHHIKFATLNCMLCNVYIEGITVIRDSSPKNEPFLSFTVK